MHSINRVLLCVLPVMLAIGCTGRQQTRTVAFSKITLIPYAQAGTAALSGRAYVVSGVGTSRPADACAVQLIPATPYTVEYAAVDLRMGRPLVPPPDPDLDQFIRKSQTDQEGRFELNALPPGQYILACHWTDKEQRGTRWLFRDVILQSGQHATVLLHN